MYIDLVHVVDSSDDKSRYLILNYIVVYETYNLLVHVLLIVFIPDLVIS